MNPRIYIPARTPTTDRLAVELAHLLGFEAISLDFPILSQGPYMEQAVTFVLAERPGAFTIRREGPCVFIGLGDAEEIRDIWLYCHAHFSQLTDAEKSPHTMAAWEGYRAASDAAHPTPPFDSRTKKGLESLFEKDFLLLDHNHDLLPDKVEVTLQMEDGQSVHHLSALCNLAARLGAETTAVAFPITSGPRASGNRFVLEAEGPCGLSLEEDAAGRIFRLTGDGPALDAFSHMLCRHFPTQGQGKSWLELVENMAQAMTMRNLDGQLAWLERHRSVFSHSTVAYCSPKVHSLPGRIASAFAPATLAGYRDLKQMHSKQYDLPWEVDVCKAALDAHLWPRVKAGDQVRIEACLSEDTDVRRSLEAELAGMAASRGAQAQVRVLNAYKQGLSWLEEAVLPELLCKDIDHIEIAFKAFLPDGQSQWHDEYGATPTYANIRTDDSERWYDLPIRYLQELYPIDDILAQGLGIDRDRITFTAYKGDEDITYSVSARAGDAMQYNGHFKAHMAERCYLDTYPGLGKVHPGTGHLVGWINGEAAVDIPIATDSETVWNMYQQEILPLCKTFCDAKTNGRPTVADQPLFAQLKLEIEMSEPDRPMGIREDLLSPLDALHEDIYFVGADFFKVYGASQSGDMLDAPGLILPIIRKGEGPPRLRVTLYDQQSNTPFIDLAGNRITPDFDAQDVHVTISALRWHADALAPVIRIDGPEAALEVARCYAGLLDRNMLAISQALRDISGLYFDLGGEEELFVPIIPPPAPKKDVDIRTLDFCDGQVIGYAQYQRIIEQLQRVPGIEVYPIAESYQGRDIYAIELTPDWGGYTSKTRRISRNPSHLINARHHANEVSGTNAALLLLHQLLTDEAFKGLPHLLNLVLVPMENVDGTEIHYALQQQTPRWKLHVARYNAIGKEFYNEYFNDATLHTEALSFTRLWRRWLPDVICDNHGVPSHEWEQPFSGYTSPSFKGFWLPRSLLYGYFWTANGAAYEGNITAAKCIERNIYEILAPDIEISAWNQDWQNRFEKYAHAWMPQLFPADYYENMINYWIPFDYSGNHRHPSIRFPWITSVAYTAEVADETAQGDYLTLCARTHALHDIAIIRMLMQSGCIYRESAQGGNGSAQVERTRLRPLVPRP